MLNSFAPSLISSNFCAGLQTLFKLQVVKSKSNPTQRLGNMMKHMLKRLVIPFICLAHIFQDRMGVTTLDVPSGQISRAVRQSGIVGRDRFQGWGMLIFPQLRTPYIYIYIIYEYIWDFRTNTASQYAQDFLGFVRWRNESTGHWDHQTCTIQFWSSSLYDALRPSGNLTYGNNMIIIRMVIIW